jgi:hypothetical protein
MKSVTRSGGPRGCLGQARVAGRVIEWWGASRAGDVGGGWEVMTRTRSAADGGLARMGGAAGRPGLAPGVSEVALALPGLASVELGAALKEGEAAYNKTTMAERYSRMTAGCSALAALSFVSAFEHISITSYRNGFAWHHHAVTSCLPVVMAYPDKAAAMASKAKAEAREATATMAKAVTHLSKANTKSKIANPKAKKAIAISKEAVIHFS